MVQGGRAQSVSARDVSAVPAIAAAAAETSTLTLGTGICLLLEHDLLDLACAVATADVLAEGRVVMGIGVGWNEEELENHTLSD